MAEFTDFDLTFTDNSSGTRAEDGTEVQIYTDSPSFVPNISVDFAYAAHPWMSLALIGAGITTVPVRLENPFTFVKVRVRQFNEAGYGPWNAPSGGAGEMFLFGAAPAVGAPDAPSAVGLLVVGTPTPPVDPPVDPPPDPEPPASTATNYTWPAQFSGTQGSSGWRYRATDNSLLTYNSASSLWQHATESYLSIWSGGWHPGPNLGSRLEWTVPADGDLTITGSHNLYSAAISQTTVIKHNAATKYSQATTTTTVYPISVASFAVLAGDLIIVDLTCSTTNNANQSTALSLDFALTSSGGGTALDPTVANISPSTLAANTGTVNSVQVNLSGPALTNATVSLSSTNGAIASVPASIIIPAGQSSGLFDITGVALGTATITASYNSSSATCVTTVSTPVVGTQWPNEPSGMTLVSDTPFSDTLPAEWFNVYNTQNYASPGGSGTTFSPPRAFDAYMAAGSGYGSGQWGINMTASREVYVGFYWSTNASFQGMGNGSNKIIFVRNYTEDNSLISWMGAQDSPRQLRWINQAIYSNAHVDTWVGDADGRSGSIAPNINGTVATMAAGTGWYFVELYLKSSTTNSSQNGILKIWVNGTLSTSVPNMNLSPSGFTEFQINQAWDNSPGLLARDLSRSWHHYFDHLRLSRKA